MYRGRVELMYALSEFPVRALVAVWSNWCLARAILGLHSTCVMPHALRTTENDPRDTDRYCWVCLDCLADAISKLSYGRYEGLMAVWRDLIS
jgi:hypothetical protein